MRYKIGKNVTSKVKLSGSLKMLSSLSVGMKNVSISRLFSFLNLNSDDMLNWLFFKKITWYCMITVALFIKKFFIWILVRLNLTGDLDQQMLPQRNNRSKTLWGPLSRGLRSILGTNKHKILFNIYSCIQKRTLKNSSSTKRNSVSNESTIASVVAVEKSNIENYSIGIMYFQI